LTVAPVRRPTSSAAPSLAWRSSTVVAFLERLEVVELRRERTLRVDPAAGERVLHRLPRGRVVHVAVDVTSVAGSGHRTAVASAGGSGVVHRHVRQDPRDRVDRTRP
jgi:hypothetical protein